MTPWAVATSSAARAGRAKVGKARPIRKATSRTKARMRGLPGGSPRLPYLRTCSFAGSCRRNPRRAGAVPRSRSQGRNDFEGLKTNRVYALLAKSPLFAELAIHPLALAFAEAELGQSCLLSAMLAINLHPGETVQPWHFDDGSVRLPRPRPAFGLSAFWAIDDTTELNGSTEVVPGSHLWNEQVIEGAAKPSDFANKTAPDAG